MRFSAVLIALLLALSVSASDRAPRNPFWEQGYEGTRRPITAEPRFHLAIETRTDSGGYGEADEEERARRAKLTAAEREVEELDDQLWSRAARTLRFGATMFVEEGTNSEKRASIVINNRVYAVGDLFSTDFERRRFTWKIESVSSDGKVRIKRLVQRSYRKNP